MPGDIKEVVNYVGAMEYGLARLGSLPLSLRLLREIHERLMAGTRGGSKSPGQFRESQNWIGGRTMAEAAFVPPPRHDMRIALGNLERFLHDSGGLDPLIVCALAHAQFETIHPFLDENGRVGRLLITFVLCHEKVLERPVLYLSHYLKQHRASYYRAFRPGIWMAVRQRPVRSTVTTRRRCPPAGLAGRPARTSPGRGRPLL